MRDECFCYIVGRPARESIVSSWRRVDGVEALPPTWCWLLHSWFQLQDARSRFRLYSSRGSRKWIRNSSARRQMIAWTVQSRAVKIAPALDDRDTRLICQGRLLAGKLRLKTHFIRSKEQRNCTELSASGCKTLAKPKKICWELLRTAHSLNSSLHGLA